MAFPCYIVHISMRISAIAALDSRRAIGKNNNLLFKIPEDFARMKRITVGHPIIIGRKTFESIGRPLPNRTNIVITRDANYQKEGIVVVHTLQEALNKAKEIEEQRVNSVVSNEVRNLSSDEISPHDVRRDDTPEIFIFGGGQIFQEAMPKIDRLYLTLVKGDFYGDTFFPDYSEFTKVVEKEEKTDWDYPYTFITLERA